MPTGSRLTRTIARLRLTLKVNEMRISTEAGDDGVASFLPTFTELLYRVGKQKNDKDAQVAVRDAAREAFRNYFGSAPESLDFGA